MTRTSVCAARFALAVVLLLHASLRTYAQAPSEVLTQAASQSQAASQQPGTYLDSLRRARDNLLGAGDAEGALGPAELILADTEERSPEQQAADEVMYAVILTELARFEDAEMQFLATIESLENTEGPTTGSVVTPLRLLGRSYTRARQFPQAIAALTQARDSSRRAYGLFNDEQTAIIDDLTTAHLGLGDTQTAYDLQFTRLESAQRQFGGDDVRVIPYHFQLADYLSQSRLFGGAQAEFDKALEIALANEDSEAALIALRSAAALELQMGASRSYTEQLVELLESSSAGSHERGLAFAVLGDAALLDEEIDTALMHYAHSWDLLAAGDTTNPAEYFADPAIIRLFPPASAVDVARRSLPWAWGTVSLEFDVGADGRVAAINGVGAEPADIMEAAYVERVESALFRPALSAGHPTESTGVVFTHFFRYYVDPDEQND